MCFDNSSNARRKRKLAAAIKRSVAKQRAGYRAKRKATEAAKLAQENQAFLLALPRAVPAPPVLPAPTQAPAPRGLPTPEELAARIELARQYREQNKVTA